MTLLHSAISPRLHYTKKKIGAVPEHHHKWLQNTNCDVVHTRTYCKYSTSLKPVVRNQLNSTQTVLSFDCCHSQVAPKIIAGQMSNVLHSAFEKTLQSVTFQLTTARSLRAVHSECTVAACWPGLCKVNNSSRGVAEPGPPSLLPTRASFHFASQAVEREQLF
jgi:hypothetical protein